MKFQWRQLFVLKKKLIGSWHVFDKLLNQSIPFCLIRNGMLFGEKRFLLESTHNLTILETIKMVLQYCFLVLAVAY